MSHAQYNKVACIAQINITKLFHKPTYNQKEKNVPYINVKITDEAVTNEQKQAIIKGCTQLMVEILNKSPATTFVIIDEVNTDNWGIGFEQVTELRKQTLATE